jgi:hypothetical protein
MIGADGILKPAGLRSMFRADDAEDRTTTRDPSVPPAGIEVEPPGGAGESEVFDPSHAALHQSLPPGSALLAVTEDPAGGPRGFRLSFFFQGRYEESTEDDVRHQVALNLNLYSIGERRRWQDDHDELKNWWRELSRLRRWMNRLAAAARDTRLVVWDNTNFQLPWELYYVDGSGWLGAMVEVLRWTSLLEEGREARYTAVPAAPAGTMLVLETEDITGPGDGIADLTEGYGPPPLTRMEALREQLARKDLRIGVLLVHCHGVNAADANQFELAGATLNEMESWDMPALAVSRTIVILNACNTAKLVPVGEHAQRATRSFAEMFLRKGASTVIATLGKVGMDHTHDFTLDLLTAEGTDRRVSQFLMRHRRDYADRLADPARGPGRYERFFYSFMYVCFGHPETALRLAAAPGDAP